MVWDRPSTHDQYNTTFTYYSLQEVNNPDLKTIVHSQTYYKDAVSPAASKYFPSVKPDPVKPCICLLSKYALVWLAPKTAVTERFVHVGISAGYQW